MPQGPVSGSNLRIPSRHVVEMLLGAQDELARISFVAATAAEREREIAEFAIRGQQMAFHGSGYASGSPRRLHGSGYASASPRSPHFTGMQ